MSQKRLSELSNLRERAWPMDLQALLTKRSMKALDVGVQIGPMRGDDIGLHPKTEQEAHQRGGEIASRRAANKAGVIVKGEHLGQAMLAQKLGHRFQQGFRIEVTPHLTVQPDRGASVDEVGNLHHMLPLAIGISRHTARIFEVELDFLPWLPRFERFGLAPAVLLDAARLAQDLPDRGLRAREAHTSLLEGRVAMHIVQDRFWSWDAPQVLRRYHADLQDALHNGWLGGDGGRGRVPRSRAGVQGQDSVGIGLMDPPEPFAPPGA